MASRDLTRSPGRRLATETKHAFKTTEFWACLAAIIAVVIAADSIGGGAHHDPFRADKAWLFVTILTAAYLISRGLAKAGSKEPYIESPQSGDGVGITDRLTKAAAVLRDGEVPETEQPRRRGPGQTAPVGERLNH